MAVQKIAFDVVLKRNNNRFHKGYGKYYPEAYKPETLDLRGLIERVAFDQSVYSRDIIEGVIQRLTKVMVELLQSAQPVKWNGLGTFTPSVESVKGGVTADDLAAGNVNIDQLVAGIHINFIPENSKGEELTSRSFKESVVLNCVGVIETTNIGSAQKKKYARTLNDIEKWKSNYAAAQEPDNP